MPAVGGMPKVGASEIEIIGARVRTRVRIANPQNGRQRLGRPENRLSIEGEVRVSREKKAPNAVEIRRSPRRESRGY